MSPGSKNQIISENDSKSVKSNLQGASDEASQKILNILRSKKTDLLAMAAEDEEILDLQLDLNEEPIT